MSANTARSARIRYKPGLMVFEVLHKSVEQHKYSVLTSTPLFGVFDFAVVPLQLSTQSLKKYAPNREFFN